MGEPIGAGTKDTPMLQNIARPTEHAQPREILHRARKHRRSYESLLARSFAEMRARRKKA